MELQLSCQWSSRDVWEKKSTIEIEGYDALVK